MKLGMIGTGYVGLVTAACLSDFGHTVICVDKDLEKIKNLNNGNIPIYEPGLDLLIKKNVSGDRLFFRSSLETFIDDLDVLFVAVDTPTRRVDGQADLNSLLAAIQEVSMLSTNNKVIVIKSTVPVGTNKSVTKILQENINKLSFEVVSDPEFLREGSAIEDFMKPDRVVVGTNSNFARKIMREVYRPLYLREFPILFTSPETAELIKYSSNAFLATKISFINEVAHICEKVGADVKDVAKGMGLDKRIGEKFLHVGPGYGGSCFPKDTLAFTESGRLFGAPQNIVNTVVKVNDGVKQRMVAKIIDMFKGDIKEKVITVFGVTFKPNTDDMREAPSLTIIPALQKEGAFIRVVDPQGYNEGSKLLENVKWFSDPYEAADSSNLILILTEWNEFRALDLKAISSKMTSAYLADFRNLYSLEVALENGFVQYDCIGRKRKIDKSD